MTSRHHGAASKLAAYKTAFAEALRMRVCGWFDEVREQVRVVGKSGVTSRVGEILDHVDTSVESKGEERGKFDATIEKEQAR